MNPEFQREMLAFEEKIALSELEEAKAHERVLELKYQKSRFSMESFLAAMKQHQQAQTEQKKG